ncbi:toll-like receptor 4 [Mytilus edulis]|uniref:toll-like receptor 4 n=1 Tax=Mytilus edulis TaxID=6550 RepID=UPI0039F05512
MLVLLIVTIVTTVYGIISQRTEYQCSYWEDRHLNLHANCSKRNFTSIPVVLSSIVSLDLSGNQIKVVHNKTFLNLSNLWELNLSFNRIEWLEIGAFLGLERLEILILRKNSLDYNSRHFSKSVFQPLKFLTNLDISLQRGRSEECNATWFSQYIISDLSNLQSIEIDISPDNVFREGFLSLSKLKKVKAGFCVMDANEKTFSNIPHVDQIDITDCVIKSYAVGTFSGRHIKYLNLSSTNPELTVWSNILQDFKHFAIDTLVLSDTIEALRKMWEHLVFNALNKTGVQKLFLDHNEMQRLCLSCEVHDFDLPITLKYLDLSSNKLICFCLSMPHLSSLNLENNNLRDYLRLKTYYPSYPSNLTVINFAFNNLDYLNVSIFHGHQSLRVLNLSNNYFTDIDFDISHLTLLQVLDLSNNRIQKFSEKSMKKLDVLFGSSNVKLNLGENILQCSCDAISFIEWLLDKQDYFSAKNETKCKFANGTTIFLTDFRSTMLQLKENCASRLVLIICISISITSMLVIAIIGIVYRYRWRLRYAYYMIKSKYKRDNIAQTDEQEYTYDAFISYADNEQDFIVRECIPNLEEGGNAKLCIHKRDFLPGNEITYNITNSIHESRKVVCIITKSFLDSYYCMFEFNMARMESIYSRSKENILFLVFLDQFRSKDLPLIMLEHVQNDSYIEYPNDEQGNVVFWEKIKEILK